MLGNALGGLLWTWLIASWMSRDAIATSISSSQVRTEQWVPLPGVAL